MVENACRYHSKRRKCRQCNNKEIYSADVLLGEIYFEGRLRPDGPDTTVYDMTGKYVMPGADCHMHFESDAYHD
ncbi:MAG: hypothetical protein ACLUGF_05665 [Clostridium sp.]